MTISTEFIFPIRPTARAVIWRDGKILAQVKQRGCGKPYLTLPGGKQEPGESLADCVARECAEEVGAPVEVGALLHLAEVFKPKEDGMRHQVEALFACTIAKDYSPRLGPEPDASQIDTIWACPVNDAAWFRPAYAPSLADEAAPLYLGVLDG
ncbi:NUDIX domain-containing protein [Qingshengfaniella alkalisoli]|uniref:NUDIX domain-containing protein n=1 Tax=Qingshengfaniella alkalisoli TaxID=2599296 RepID=A0A5B8IWT1_9RHOB|nr:NUDIX domain-containing protein [Qingshengfaniella alkalisoli]QDY70612.1 NUDIX domain-containing protein [Qingshengfaniella alkalisoli]